MAETDTTRRDQTGHTGAGPCGPWCRHGAPPGRKLSVARLPRPDHTPMSSKRPALAADENLDNLRPVRPLLIATRWGTLAVGLAVAATASPAPRALTAGL